MLLGGGDFVVHKRSVSLLVSLGGGYLVHKMNVTLGSK
jgi:hypothetical protein